jgi:hypothetical protein
MNQESSTTSSQTTIPAVDAISQRAYELWEREGRPEGSDLRHWLQAEQELRARTNENTMSTTHANTPPSTGSDVRPLQGTRAAAAANREVKRGSSSPFGGERSAGNSAAAGRRKPTNSPAL